MLSNLFKNSKEPIISFIPSLSGLSLIPECTPKPSSNFIPEWWKTTKLKPLEMSTTTHYQGNIKNCPSFAEWFSKGYVVPMWADSFISYDKEQKTWNARTRDNRTPWGAQPEETNFLNDMPYKHLGVESVFAFKAISPWKIVTKPGYSILVLPLFFHFNSEYSVVPGIVDTDTHHVVNPDIVYHTDKKEVYIERGTPLFQVVPFKRESQTYQVAEIVDIPKTMFKRLARNDAQISTKFSGLRAYQAGRKQGNN
jgi:hypothetical protein